MAGDMFLKIEGLKGESVDAATPSHKEEIDIISWSIGVMNPASFAMGQGGQQAKPTWSDFQIMKTCDKGTAALLNAVSTGKHFKSAQITCRKAIGDDNKLEYLVIKLTDVLITGVHQSGSGHEQYVHESVSITSAKVEFTYQPQDDETGQSGGNFDFVYDLQKQTATLS